MTKIKNDQNRISWTITLSLILLLFVGIIISVAQIRNKSNIQSRADNSPVITNCEVSAGSLSISAEEQNFLDEINAYRQEHGLSPFVLSSDLMRAASWMSNDMLVNQYLNHMDSSGRSVSVRVGDCGYRDFTFLGENIDSGTPDSVFTFNSWKHSPPHNSNLLNPNFKDAGIALVTNPDTNSYFWTLDLGNKEIPPTLSPTPTVLLTPTPTSQLQITPTRPIASATPIATRTPTPTRIPTRVPTLYPTSTPRVMPTAVPTRIVTPAPTSVSIPSPVNTRVPTINATPTLPPGYVQNSEDMQIFVLAKVSGIGNDGNQKPKHRTRHVTVGIYDASNKVVAEGNGFMIFDGSNLFGGVIHFGPVENDTYYIKIMVDHMLQIIVRPTFQALDSGRLNILPQVNLIQGDINDDNVVDINDYNLGLGCFQNKKCDDRELIDFNDDGIASIIDYNILLHDYWETLGD